MLRLFDSDPVKFYEQFKLGLKKKQKSTTSLIIGDLVDFFLLDCRGDEEEFERRFDEKFALFEGTKGNGQVFLLADILFEITQEDTNEDSIITTEFDTRFQQAYTRVVDMGKYSGKTKEKALEDFNKNGLSYFEKLLENSGRTVVDISLINKAKKIVNILLEDSFTRDVFIEDEHTEYFSKFPIEWKSGWQCKSEIDMLRIDHEKKKIYLMDLKTTYDNENFEYSYLKNGYYIQAAFYFKAVKYWAVSEGMSDYTVIPMEFIVADTSSNNRRPIRYKTSMDDLERSLNGFTIRGTRYNGVEKILEDLTWCERNDNWDCSPEVFKNDGEMKLNLKYE